MMSFYNHRTTSQCSTKICTRSRKNLYIMTIQLTTKNKSLSTPLLAHMPVAGPKGRCGYCSTKARPIFSNIKCSFCGISLCVKQHKNCFLLFHENTV
jgi:hypothetical protein